MFNNLKFNEIYSLFFIVKENKMRPFPGVVMKWHKKYSRKKTLREWDGVGVNTEWESLLFGAIGDTVSFINYSHTL